jgi:hypothetical protein
MAGGVGTFRTHSNRADKVIWRTARSAWTARANDTAWRRADAACGEDRPSRRERPKSSSNEEREAGVKGPLEKYSTIKSSRDFLEFEFRSRVEVIHSSASTRRSASSWRIVTSFLNPAS